MKKDEIKLIVSRIVITFLFLVSANCLTTGIYKASKEGDLATVKRLIEEGASVDESDSWSLHPIHYAAEKGNIEIAKLLLEKGASIHALDVREYTPLHFAA
ncbi:MAG TPA: ankyrin repeat domain-containing protein, partial [Leptospiraceae bacterium]|nr:ankyrin repeat domain-containing protein [Leptospiraceae bacterium]